MIRRSAFTLVELLVVIAVIAVLIAILLPAIGRAKKQGKTVICATNLRALTGTLQSYISDTGKMVAAGGHNGPMALWDYQLLGGKLTIPAYYTNGGGHAAKDKIRICPETPRAVVSGIIGNAVEQWNCNGSTPYGKSVGSYVINGWLYSASDPRAKTIGGNRWTAAEVYKVQGAKNEGMIPVFSDGSWHDFMPKPTDAAPANLQNPGPTTAGDASLARAVMDRHAMAVNVSFLDGHVEKVRLQHLWSLSWSAKWLKTDVKRVK